MQTHMLPLNTLVLPDYVDYTPGLITRHYTLDNSRYFFTMFPEYHHNDGFLVPTGRYFTSLLTPKGLRAFYLVKDKKEKYVIDDTEDEVAADPLTNHDGFTSEYAKAILKEIRQRLNFIKECLVMMNQAIAESRL